MRNVWDFPRPPLLQPAGKRVRIELDGELLIETDDAVEVLETSHPPVIYVRRDELPDGLLTPAATRPTWCEFKGTCVYFDVGRVPCGAWAYPEPVRAYRELAGRVGLYAEPMACYLDGERVQPQAGGWYGGWITADLEGPFKGPPGTLGW